MKELKQLVSEAFDKIVASGAIEKAIEKQIAETVTSAITDQLRSYSDFGKAVKEQVSAALAIDLSQAGLPTYGHFVTEIIRRRVDATMQGQFAAQLEKDIGELLAPAPAEITLEQLIERFIEAYKEGREGREFTLRIERESYGYVSIALDKEERASKYDCDFRISLNKEGEVYHLAFGHHDVSKTLFAGPFHGFERTLFQLYAAKSKLIVPAEVDVLSHDYPTHFPWND